MAPKVRTKAAYPSLEESSKWLTEQSKCDGGLELQCTVLPHQGPLYSCIMMFELKVMQQQPYPLRRLVI